MSDKILECLQILAKRVTICNIDCSTEILLMTDDFYFGSLKKIADKFNVTIAVVSDVQDGKEVQPGTDIEGILNELVNAGLRLEIFA